jgi:hypothetical protein
MKERQKRLPGRLAGLVPGVALVGFGAVLAYAAHKVRQALAQPAQVMARVTDTRSRTPVDCPKPGPRTLVLLVVGQSHSANYAGERFVGLPGNLQALDGRCYPARDPALGTDGAAGNLWTQVGNVLVESRAYDAVVVALAAVGSVPVAAWAPGGKLQDVLRDALRLPDGLAPTRVVISEGATDRIYKTDPAAFKASYQALIQSLRAKAPQVPLYVSFETGYCSSTDVNVYDPRDPIRVALDQLVDPPSRIFGGADMDAMVGAERRYDGCHMDGQGSRRIAAEWARILSAP